MGIYLNSISNTGGYGSGVLEAMCNCTTGFEFRTDFTVPQPGNHSLNGNATSFWPGLLVGTPSEGDWLMQPLLTQAEGSNDSWAALPAAWIQAASGAGEAQLGWDDSTARLGNVFVPSPGDSITSIIAFEKDGGTWSQSMQIANSGTYFTYLLSAGQQYRNKYVCPDNSRVELIYLTIETQPGVTADQIWRGEIDCIVTITVDGTEYQQDFTNTELWAGWSQNPQHIPNIGLVRGKNQLTLTLPPVAL